MVLQTSFQESATGTPGPSGPSENLTLCSLLHIPSRRTHGRRLVLGPRKPLAAAYCQPPGLENSLPCPKVGRDIASFFTHWIPYR